MLRLTPINMAEAIFEPFWDPQLSGLGRWQVQPGEAHGLHVFQQWCFAQFEWARRPASGPALHMTRPFDLDCTGYDHLIISVMAPDGATLRLQASTDCGDLSFSAPPTDRKREYAIPLEGATCIGSIALELESESEGVASGWFNWIGLQNAGLLERLLAEQARYDASWQEYLVPPDYQPQFEPSAGILISTGELAEMRREHDAFVAAHGESPYTAAADLASRLQPERMIHDYVNFWTDTRYCRERDNSHLLLTNGPAAAIAGLLLRDPELLRLGARYAISLAMCDHWDDGFICAYPGSTFEHRSFVQSLCCHETALLLDLAGEMFTDLGREFIRRRIAEAGLGNINFNTWRHEYIFHCNQLAWFTPGRILGYLMLERDMPRAQPYTEIAYNDLIESLGHTILADGGYVEGPTYFRCVARDGGLSLYYYARARNVPFRSVVPEVMLRTADFAAAVASTDEDADVIPICDAHTHMEQEGLAVMASLLPDSAWPGIYRKSLARGGFSHSRTLSEGPLPGGMPDTVLGWQLGRAMPADTPDLPVFTYLPEMGIMASVRHLGGERVKLFIQGNRAGAGHTHEDKGSFVLEYAGDTFAMDPGTCDYANPLSYILKQAERHNMLVPSGTPERPHPVNPLPADVKPDGLGDEITFRATIDATPGWSGYFQRWQRTWDSPDAAHLTIHDEYELASGEGVEFYWQTRLPVEVSGRVATICGRRATVRVKAPAGWTVRVDELPLLDGTQRRIAICRVGRSGSLDVRVTLLPADGQPL